MTNEQPVALITGSAKRIGAALVRRFHDAGYRLIIHFNGSEEEALSLQAERHAVRADSVSCLQAALTERSEVAQLAQNALDCFGRIDVLINNASSFYATPLEDSTQGQWDDLIDSNLRGAYFLSVALSQELTRRQGNIINILDAMVDGAYKGFSHLQHCQGRAEKHDALTGQGTGPCGAGQWCGTRRYPLAKPS